MSHEGHAAEGCGTPGLEADGELSLARIAMADGDPGHAARHVGDALAHDPGFAPAYEFIGELVQTSGGIAQAKALFETDGPLFIGAAAALADLHARSGDYPRALVILADMTAATPDKPWAAAPWFSPRLAAAVPDTAIAAAVSRISRAIGDPARPPLAEPLAPWLALTRAAAAQPQTGSPTLGVLSGLARRLGAADEAIAWCEESERREHRSGSPSPNPAIMLGYAYRSAGRPADTIEAWKRALALDPANIDLYIDLAETCMAQGDFPEAAAWADRAARVDPKHLKPKAVRLAARFQSSTTVSPDGDSGPLIELVDLALANREHPYPRVLIQQCCDNRPWLNAIPPPTEAIANVTGHFLADKPADQATFPEAALTMTLTAIEAPSAIAAVKSLFPQAELSVTRIPQPDIRIPGNTGHGPAIWTYRTPDGAESTEARATVPQASPIAVEKLYQTATGYWRDPIDGYERAVAFAGLGEAELLGLLAHVPPSPPIEPWTRVRASMPLYWQRVAQAWTCVGILHHNAEQPWPQSDRRAILLRLLSGPEDWTVDAAAFALCVSAWLFPDQRDDVAGAVATRYLDVAKAAATRPSELHDPLARVLLICPEANKQVVQLAHEVLAQRAAVDAEADSGE